jgi:1-acyl-sn-glycerol-3-phosphate acyltransferase
MEFWYQFARFFALSYRNIFIPKLHVDGMENIFPGPKIIVANHSFASDVFIIPSIIKDRLHFLIEEDLLMLPFFGRLLALSDQIPVSAGRGREALSEAYQRLLQGHSIVIFPEGKLNHGKEVTRARSGAIHLALQSGFPMLPLGIYTPPRFTRIISKQNFGRETVGGWQFGGSSFVSIGNAWNLSQEIETLKDTSSYRIFRHKADELKIQLENLVHRASELAGRWGLQSLTRPEEEDWL